ncbi:hypothetical protein LWI28_011930 [Acer negundo]|uniref:RING-type domain-containing protein n=1 Tax=Acer negundo TaxID=4023 RepID=A0AAD5ITS6_ACENE|nr:hypothetical protein LWI28_011930 [Acer negundo]
MPPNSVVVTIEKPNNFSLVELNGSDSSSTLFPEKQKGVSPKQFTWFIFLKANRAFACLSWLATAFKTMFVSAKKRVALLDVEEEPKSREKLYRVIKAFLVISIVALVIEVVAHFKKWNLNLIQPWEVQGLVQWSYMAWLSFRVDYIAPLVIALSKFCVVLFLIQSLDRLVLCLGCFWIKYKNLKPKIDGEAYDIEDSSTFPKVLVQIPMCNEREVFAQSIGAASQLDWPKDRILIQVLDDSDDINLQDLIKDEVLAWQEKGVNIIYRHRLIRTGYKAGNLKSAMGCEYVKDYEFVAIFDADFQPNSDFLKRTVPHFKGNPELGLVQARWSFVNRDENLLTRLQNINLCFHFEVEQQVNGVYLNFFGFNGTAGVWRIKTLEESGGWLERTTVEDMDIAVRAHLNGWKFIFLNDVKVLCELPESYEAYKKQQHRWHSGPMQLFRLCLPAIITSKISIWKKANLIFLFFLLRKLILPFYSFTLFCIILPLTMFIPEAELPLWVICYVPIFMSFLNILPSPKSFPFLVPYLLFENTMSVTKFNAMVSGLFQLGSAYEWVVTKKTGRSSESDLVAFAERESSKSSNEEKIHRRHSESGLELLSKLKEEEKVPVKKKRNRIYRKELVLAFLLLTAAARSLLSAHGVHFYFLLFQGLSFLVMGLDLIAFPILAANLVLFCAVPELEAMDCDSFSIVPLPSLSKDLGKKKRGNRLAKLKQCKLDVRRQQWLSQIKNKGCKDGSIGRNESSSSMQIAYGGNKSLDIFKSRAREEESEGLSIQNRDLETLMIEPICSSLCNKDSSKGLSGSNRGTSSSSYSGSVCDDEEDECVDDWEAVADALNADNDQHQHSPIVDHITESETNVRLADFEQAEKNSGVDLPVKESRETVRMNCQAWMPDDAFRPQTLPSLSKQHDNSSNSGWHCGHGVVTWGWHNIMPQPSSCPICCEDLDVTDSSFLPCSCGFRLCLFCHKRILEADGRCPGCRKQYDLIKRDTCFNGGTTPFWSR